MFQQVGSSGVVVVADVLKKTVWLFCLIVFAIQRPATSSAPSDVSVLIMSRHHPDKIEISCTGGAAFNGDGRGSGAKKASFTTSGGKLSATAGARTLKSGTLAFSCPGDVVVTLPENGISRSYAGNISVARDGGELKIINTLPLERYVASVTAGEMVSRRVEALKAQAVLARTFAVKNRGRHGGYDFCDLSHCQLYRGAARLPRAAAHAAAATAGLILTRGGTPVDVFYHSTCGGKTTSPRHVWGDPEATFPRGVDDGANCARSPQFRWDAAFTSEELRRVFGAGAPVDDVKIIERDPSGRTMRIAVRAGGATRVFSGIDTYRGAGRALGWGRLKSTHFEVSKQGRVFVFRGRGLGHGVGLCQWGADGLARNGATFTQILNHYFPDAVLRKTVK